jgi:hypothetical protein
MRTRSPLQNGGIAVSARWLGEQFEHRGRFLWRHGGPTTEDERRELERYRKEQDCVTGGKPCWLPVLDKLRTPDDLDLETVQFLVA